jgi:hypothetical protein
MLTANENTYGSITVATNSTIGYDRNELGLGGDRPNKSSH